MKIRWIRERQFHDKLGLIETGRIIDTEKEGVSEETARNWIESGWAEAEIKTEEIREEAKEEAKEELPIKPKRKKSKPIISEEVI